MKWWKRAKEALASMILEWVEDSHWIEAFKRSETLDFKLFG